MKHRRGKPGLKGNKIKEYKEIGKIIETIELPAVDRKGSDWWMRGMNKKDPWKVGKKARLNDEGMRLFAELVKVAS